MYGSILQYIKNKYEYMLAINASLSYYQFFSNMPKSLLNLININFNCIITHSQNGKQENAKAQLN